jgi:hypothetical protein
MSEGPDGALPHLAGRLEGGVHRLPVRVYYEDTDFSDARPSLPDMTVSDPCSATI